MGMEVSASCKQEHFLIKQLPFQDILMMHGCIIKMNSDLFMLNKSVVCKKLHICLRWL